MVDCCLSEYKAIVIYIYKSQSYVWESKNEVEFIVINNYWAIYEWTVKYKVERINVANPHTPHTSMIKKKERKKEQKKKKRKKERKNEVTWSFVPNKVIYRFEKLLPTLHLFQYKILLSIKEIFKSLV